jgi:hypothetical protein
MIKQTPAKIFLAEQRGLVETPQFHRLSTFSFGSFADEHKAPFGRLQALNEETLAAGYRQELSADEAAQVLILPITGAVQAAVGGEPARLVDVGQVLLLTVPAGDKLQLSNPYDTELISVLHLWLRVDELVAAPAAQSFAFATEALENQLAEIIAPATAAGVPGLALSLGRFAGRREAIYKLRGSRCFAFVLAGAFELEGRLLHEKDGLALWDLAEVELEALSNDALVLLVEV